MNRYLFVLTGRTTRERCDVFDLFEPFGLTVVVGPDALRVIGFDIARRDEAFALARRLGFDAALVPEGVRLSDYGALFFDMDSTLCNSETLDEMADILGVGDECARITADAMAGRITDYAASLRARVALLKGMPADCIETVAGGMAPNPGVETLLTAARAAGLKTYIVSSGFTILTERMRSRLSMTATCANRIEIEDGRFTGRVFGPVDDVILDASGKKAFVEKTMASLGLPLAKAICCGDGSNDVKMIDAAGLGVGFRPKEVLRPHCDIVLEVSGFDALLTALS